ncbi:hypothetical protein BGZ46_007357 [Entomortierella lignicola]|nr:hypothetical protein BGZ46_007357 [Entomortierella lignicola]
MGQSNSTLANQPPSQPPSSPSSIENVLDVSQRILSTTNKALGELGGTIVSIAKPVISSLPGQKKSIPAQPPSPPPSVISRVNLWTQKNPGKAVLWAIFISTAIVGGGLTYKTMRSRQKQMKKSKIVRGTDGTKREIVVITNGATFEGAVLALDLEERGFIVFVGVKDQLKADEVLSWGRADIHPVVISDLSDAGDLDIMITQITNFLDEHNGVLDVTHKKAASSSTTETAGSSSPVFSTSSSFMLIEDETTGNPLLTVPEADGNEPVPTLQSIKKHYSNEPVFRLSTVIVNPKEVVKGPIEELDVDAWRQCLEVNVTGTILIVQRLLPFLKKAISFSAPGRSPRIILITSAMAGYIGLPNQSVLSASHHAVNSVADSLRREIQHKGINVVNLRLGVMESSHPVITKKIKNAGSVGLLSSSSSDPIEIFKSIFRQPPTSQALCDATFNAIIDSKPVISQAVGHGSFLYSFVGWAAPKRLIDWSFRDAASQAHLFTPVTSNR